ncbi:MAG: homogentisate 1,2-dioxygenase [Desulfurellaceae bacterium]|nr:homogentisate 1,2-dioxygenase [Desulfurellaceae bacterium]
MKSWIHFSKGQVPHQAHVGVGELKEDELGRQGFSGRVAELYHVNEPTGWTRIEGPLRPWDINSNELSPSDQDDPRGVPLTAVYNADVSIAISRRSAPMPYYVRNADGDEIYFIHRGTGTFETEFGPLAYEPGDYIALPKGVTYRVVPDGADNFFMLIESIAEVEFPDYGGLGRHAPFDPAVIQVPEPQVLQANGQQEWELRIKRESEYTSVYYPFHPLDVVGWKGDLFPFKMNIRDYRPIMSDRLHLPPSVHCIFQAKGFVVCNFMPRPAESERDVERVPWYHRNIDYDEVVLVHAGTLLGAEVPPGTMLVNPQGIHHGLGEEFRQWEKANWRKDEYFDWQLINVDCERPIKVTPEVQAAVSDKPPVLE